MSLYQEFQTNIRAKLQKEHGYQNINQVPKITKIVVSMGIGSLATRKSTKDFSEFEKHLAKITGQKPHMIKSRKSVSNFKLRAGMPVMLKCTLRKEKAHDFLLRLIALVFPRVRDFHGVSAKSFDPHGNLNLGFKHYDIFPEIGPDDMKVPLGIQITVVTTADSPTQAQQLLEGLGMVFLPTTK